MEHLELHTNFHKCTSSIFTILPVGSVNSVAIIGLVQSLNSPFFPSPIGAEPGQAKGESRITCMRMLRTPPFFPPKSGEKPYLEVLSRFGLWRDFLNIRDLKIAVIRHFPRTANVKKSRDHCVGVRFADHVLEVSDLPQGFLHSKTSQSHVWEEILLLKTISLINYRILFYRNVILKTISQLKQK